jgi:hypothetical protein
MKNNNNTMKTNKTTAAFVASLAILAAGQASAHITYSSRDFGTFAGGRNYQSVSISSNNISSDFGWAAATDDNFGDSHRTRAYRFNLASPGTVTLTVQSVTSGFLPGFTIYSGLSHLAPNAPAHDAALASLNYLGTLPGPTKVGALFALGDWAIGNDPVYNTPNDPLSGIAVAASLRYFGYLGNAADGTTANYGFAAGINGDGVADGFVTGSFDLAAGDYSIFVGGANLAGEGPVYSNQAANLTLTVIPEPSGSLLLGLAGTGLALRRRR